MKKKKTKTPPPLPLDPPPEATDTTGARGRELGRLVDKGMQVMSDIMERTEGMEPEEYRLARLKLDAAKGALTAQIKVDENQLRAQKERRLQRLVARMLETDQQKDETNEDG